MVTHVTSLEAELLRAAGAVPDPELPVLTLAELGVLRALRLHGTDTVEVDLTPTYTGCPAVETMATDIEHALREHGMRDVTVRTVLQPAWSTDDITPDGLRKLRESGIAPPRRTRPASGPLPLSLGPTRTRGGRGADAAAGPDTLPAASPEAAAEPEAAHEPPEPIRCPQCGSADTELLSRFSSTACKALRRCLSCREPFDHVKEL